MPTKVCLVKAMVFPVVMYGYESWTIKKAEHGKIDAFELWCWRRLSRVLGCKEIIPVNPQRNQPWIFIGRTDSEAETRTLATWCKELTHWKEPDAGKDCLRLKKKGTTEDEMVGWHHRLNGQEFKWASSGSWWWTGKPGMLQSMGHKESDMTEWLNWTELMTVFYYFNEYALGISSKHSEALKSYSVRFRTHSCFSL